MIWGPSANDELPDFEQGRLVVNSEIVYHALLFSMVAETDLRWGLSITHTPFGSILILKGIEEESNTRDDRCRLARVGTINTPTRHSLSFDNSTPHTT